MIITIARQYGCGALAIGKMLGAAYGIPFYTRKGLLEMARAEGVLEEMDDFFEERPVDELLFAISALGHSEGPVHSRALDILSDMIGQRNCIIIGRCGNYIFRRRADLVSVFLKGREDERVRAVVAEQGIGMAEARERHGRQPGALPQVLHPPAVGQLERLRPVLRQREARGRAFRGAYKAIYRRHWHKVRALS